MSTNNAESEIRTTEHQTNARFLLAADGDGPWAFDLDGTLYEGQRIDGMYQDPDILAVSVKPIKHACALVRSLLEKGHEVHFITGRSRLVGGITLDHLRRDVWQDIPAQNLHVQRIYTGVGALLQHKAMTLERIKAWCYVGDQDVDARAASMAGATFLPAHTFHGPDRVVQP